MSGMPEETGEELTPPAVQFDEDTFGEGWDAALPRLRNTYPGVSDGILFCIYKLKGDPSASIRDFRDEARLRGIPLSGRSIHSAKVLLGWEQPSRRRSRTEITEDEPLEEPAAPAPRTRERRAARMPSGTAEPSLIEAIQRLQDAAAEEANRLREAMRQAIDVLQAALDER